MLTTDEKNYLWSKLELNKKKMATEKENDLYELLKTDKKVSTEDFIKILNSLEYGFKKRLKEGPDMSSESFKSIKEKLPEEWMGVKFSNIEQQKKKMAKKPTTKSSKAEILDYLKRNKIEFGEDMSKTELVALFENNNVLTFQGFMHLKS